MISLEMGGDEVAPLDAATLLVLREPPGAAGIEIFSVRRHGKSSFMGGAVVFPGGKLDPADADPAFVAQSDGIHPRGSSFAVDAGHALALAVCACREALEEGAILPCRPEMSAARVEDMRGRMLRGETFVDSLVASSLVLTTAALVPFARWITPRAERKRFDARFFLTTLPPGQHGSHDRHETVSSTWSAPSRLLDAYQSGDFFLAPPTQRALELLASVGSIERAVLLCAEQSLLPICPCFVPSDPPMLTLPGDPEHEISERRVAGPTRYVLRSGRFVGEDPS